MKNLPQYNNEVILYNQYIEGIRELNVKKIYKFVDALKRSHHYSIHKPIAYISYILYKINKINLINIINSKDNIFIFQSIIYYLSNIQKLDLAIHSSNILFKFEAIKDIVYFKFVNSSNQENELIANLIFEISKNAYIYEQFLEFYMPYPARSPKLALALASFINRTNLNNIILIAKKIQFRIYEDNKENNFFTKIYDNLNYDKKRIFGRHVYKIYNDKIDNINESMVNIPFYSTINIVLKYCTFFLPEKFIIKKLNNDLYKFLDKNNMWFKNEIDYDSFSFSILSSIFLYILSLKEKNSNIEFKDIKQIIEDDFFVKEHKSSISVYFKKYIF